MDTKDTKTKAVPEIGQWWPNHPWVALNPSYAGRVFSPIQNCPYYLHSKIVDGRITYTKQVGEVAMNTKGQIHGMFWLASGVPPPAQQLDPLTVEELLETLEKLG